MRRRPAGFMQGISSQLVPACALTVLTTSQAMLVEAAKAAHGGKIPYDTSVAVFLTEALKLCIALVTWLWQRPNLEYTGLETFSPLSWSTLAYTVPATLFIVQNNLVFQALSLLDPPTFQLWACFKIIPVGILARLILGQRRSTVQWAALGVLALGMATTTTDCKVLTQAGGSGRWLGIGIITFNGFLSALSSIVNEWLIKFSDPRAPLMFKNMQIYFWGCLVAAGYSFAHSSSAAAWHALLGQAVTGSPLGVAIILNNAAVGLCVSAVIKYADNLTKGFSTSAAVLLASAASSVTFGFVPTRSFLVGTAVACSAFYLYFGPHNVILLAHADVVERAAKTTAELESLNADEDVEVASFVGSHASPANNKERRGRQ